MDNLPEWCHDCAEGWDYHRSLGVALCPLHAAAPALLEALKAIMSYPSSAPAIHLFNAETAIRMAQGEK